MPNPIPSTDVTDFLDNVKDFDSLCNLTAGTYVDRFGNTRLSVAEFFKKNGYEVPVAFASGISVSRVTQTVTYSGMTYHALATAIPFTTTGTFNPAQWEMMSGLTRQELGAEYGGSLIGAATYSQLRTYNGDATRMPLVDGGIAIRRGTAADNGGTVWVDALGRSWEREFSGAVNAKWFDIGTGGGDDLSKINAMLDSISSAGGGEILFDSDQDYLVSDAVRVKSNLVLRFAGKGFIKLTQSSTVGSILSFIGTSASHVENVIVYNPQVDGNNMGYPTAKNYGENGVAGSKCRNIRVYGGTVKNCRRGASNPVGTGGKAVQFEDGVDDIDVMGLTAVDCTIAMETGGVPDVASPYEFRRAKGVRYTNMRAIRCERIISLQQTLSPPDTAVTTASAVIDGVIAINCGREGVAGTELNFAPIVNDRASNVSVKNVQIFNDSSYGKVNAVIKQHRGTNCEYEVTFFGSCDSLVSHYIPPDAGTVGNCKDNIFSVSHTGVATYAVDGPDDAMLLENLYILNTDTITSLLGSGVQGNSGLYGKFSDSSKGKSIEGAFNTIAAFFSNNYAAAPTAFAGEVRVNGILLTLTSGAHKIASTDDLILAVAGSDKARFNSAGAILYGLPVYADNAAAGSLSDGQLYRTSSGQVMVKY